MPVDPPSGALALVDVTSASAFPPIEVLAVGVDSYADCLRADGDLADPVARMPTQYGTAYHAFGNAVLAELGSPHTRADHLDRALRGIEAALRRTADPAARPTASGFARATASVRGTLNHRDFTWPPIMRSLLILDGLGADSERITKLRELVRGVDVHASFRSRPPSNWCAVWMSGEWIRMREGLSLTSVEEFDEWLDVFFDEAFEVDLGLFVEKGLPNAYDLFTRTHLADLLVEGYDGRNRQRLLDFLGNGLRRSLAMQLSDGSVASGYRSTGQTWTLGAQIAFFTAAGRLGLGGATDRDAAALAAWRTLGSLAQWQRRDGYFSPVQNLQPPARRVGYEGYTADGHYASLALGFLAAAIHNGFPQTAVPSGAELDARPATVRAEGTPTYRGTAHRGRISVAVQAQADGVYDGTGLVDLTFGAGRLLGFATSVRHLTGGPWLNLGLGLRTASGGGPIAVVSGRAHELVAGPASIGRQGEAAADSVGLAMRTRLTAVGGDDPIAGWDYQWRITLAGDGIDVEEGTPGHTSYPCLLVPYLLDLGDGFATTISWLGANGVRVRLGDEWVEVRVDATVEARLHMPYDFQNRRGVCGLVRFDLAEPAELVRWNVRSSA